MTDPKPSFLESISPWSLSRTATPKPGDATKKEEHESLQQGGDHIISGRPRLSLSRYPRDCPRVSTRWYYAVDVPKRKPLLIAQSQQSGTEEKPQTSPKKFVPFSLQDSQRIETAFQNLAEDRDHAHVTNIEGDIADAPQARNKDDKSHHVKVPVNEDFLFDVDVEERELSPAYWLGPIYEVRRGTWFYQEGNILRPCDENLATQLEEGYLKIRPWRYKANKRSTSQPRPRPTSLRLSKDATPHFENSSSTPTTPRVSPADDPPTPAHDAASGSNQTYRLFGTYMNSIATYQDDKTVLLSSDDFMSRMSSSVYQTLGSVGGRKLVRGYVEPGKGKESTEPKPSTDEFKASNGKDSLKSKRKSAPAGTISSEPMNRSNDELQSKGKNEDGPEESMAKLERQMSKLESQNAEEAEEASRKRDEKEMEEFFHDANGGDQNREIDHLVLVTHGIGQRLGLRLDSINFVHDVNVLRKTLKAVYASAPDLQALNSQVDGMPKNSRIQVLPVSWRHLLDFPKQSLKQNRKELDLTDVDDYDDDYPDLADITVDGVPAVRNLITDLAMDVLLYQSAYREHIAGIVQRECNRVYKLFKERHPLFNGRVSLIGHSLGSAVFFDILCRQRDGQLALTRPLKRYSRSSKGIVPAEERPDFRLDFECENFFCLGSPIALFQMLKGRRIAARDNKDAKPAQSPFDPDTMDDPFLGTGSTAPSGGHYRSAVLPIAVSSPKCREFYNIFHPTDPISYRIEPLVSPAMSSMKPQLLPYTKRGLFGAQGIGARVGQSVGTFWSSFTSGVASSLLNRSLGLTGDDQAVPAPVKEQAQSGASKSRPAKGGGKASKDESDPETPATVSDEKKRELAEDTSKAEGSGQSLPTLIDSEMETLYSGFEKRRRSHQSDGTQDFGEGPEWQDAEERARRLKIEESKIRALNSNGRIDYQIQEGVFDISLIASIASHLAYWSDEDVNHFIISQLLSKGRSDRG